ncbi:MAG: aryl-sulfate sulfotransferase [Erysipelotrichales bacterium]|nr:aryl-sulfate sulfotransferase [Erysipelotrichales bacterium]
MNREMQKKRKKKIILIASIVLITCIGLISLISFNKKETNLISGDVTSAILPIVSDQEVINKRLEAITKDSKYTFESPYVELNPYKISPLSAIVIFNTDEEKEVDVYINDIYFTKMEASKKHIIPIYGLFEDYNNIIKLVMDDSELEYLITTEKSNIDYPLEILEKSEYIKNDDLYFTVASYATWLTGWDIDGKLRFYLTEDYRMDVEWLDNGHFLIGTTQGQSREQFVGFFEMDYLGKIYNYYVLEHGYSFEFQILKNGNYMLAGGNEPIYMTDQYIYELNPKDGEVVSEINLSDIIRTIDSNFPEKYLGASAIRNGFYLEEQTRELVVSFREINTILSFDYDNKTLNWIFTNPNHELFAGEVWDQYKVISDTGRYPLGQHTPSITNDGYLAFYNNGYDRYAMSNGIASDNVADYKDAYTSVEIYDIKDNKATLKWSYDYNKSVLAIKYGLFRVCANNHKLINNGYILKDEYREIPGSSISQTESGPDNIYAMILELDENDNVVFKAISEEGKYRVFKHSLYNDITPNIEISKLNIIETIKEEALEKVDIEEYDLDNTFEFINRFEYTKNTFTTDYNVEESDLVEFLFISKDNSYKFTYKNKDNININRVFNLNLPKGTYQFYIKINDNIYSTNKAYKY